ncbi:MAG: PAS domain-containing protein [Methanosarcinaceae archaeon]|nr:PAS domain-containing protein [Methanosarcinaceae archaeon]
MEWKKLPLRSKLTLFILVGTLFVLLTTTAVIISSVTSQEEELAYQQSIEIARKYANQFDADMKTDHAIGKTIAISMSQYNSADREEVNDMLRELLVTNPNLVGTYVCYEANAFDGRDNEYIDAPGHDVTGRFIPYWNKLTGELVLDPLLDYDSLEYYQVPKAIEADFVTEPYFYEGVFIISFVSPIMKEGQFVGIGGVDVSLNYLDDVMNQVKAFDTGYAFMTGNSGIMISHPTNKESVGFTTLYDYDIPKINKMADEIKNGSSGYIETVDPITGEISVMFYEPVQTSNFAFILVVPKDEMLAGVAALRERLMIIFAMSIIFMGGVAFLISESITRPINRIVDGFKDISDDAVSGKLDLRANTDVDIDFRKIPESLNEILDTLQESNRLKEEMEKIIENSPAIVFKWRTENNWPIEFVSKNITQFGYSRDELMTNNTLYASMIHPDDLKKVEDELNTNVKGGHSEFNIEYRILTKSGEVRWVDERTFIRRDESGDADLLQGIVVDINERKRAEEKLLKVEDIRKKEIHHRIKNNLQVISTLLYLESEKFMEKDVIDAFKNSRNRIRTMALVHEKLYQSEDMESVGFAEYSRNLINYLSQSYVLEDSKVTIELNVKDIYLSMDTAIPLGIIINELVSNALKYAFNDGEVGRINIEMDRAGDEFTLIVSDNGIGIPEEIDFRATESLGLQLVTTLVEQIYGSIELSREHGTQFTIKFEEHIQQTAEVRE